MQKMIGNIFFKLMNVVFGKPKENLGSYRDIKPAYIKERRNYLVSEPN